MCILPKRQSTVCIHKHLLRTGANEERGPGRSGFQIDLSHRHGLIIDLFCGVQGVCACLRECGSQKNGQVLCVTGR